MTDTLLAVLNVQVVFLITLSFFQVKMLIDIKQNGKGK